MTPMLLSSRSLLHRTASAIGWWTASGVSGEDQPLPQALETIAESSIAGGYAAGLAIAFCLPIKYPSAISYGLANLETGTEVTTGTLFRIGVCAHQFTAAAVLLLAERSQLRLDDSIATFFPEAHDAGDVTVRHLLTGDENSYLLLRRLVERVSGHPYCDFVTNALLLPAGMEASRFEDPDRILPGRASGYRLAGDRMHDFRNASSGRLTMPADGLYATAGDLLLWNRALYSGWLLSRESVQLMTTAHATAPACPVLSPVLSRAGRGFGLQTGRLFGRHAFWQRGQAPGFDSWLFHFPDERIDLALLANTEQGAATILEPMLRTLLRT
jgi:D-alanyl-D-alanine carboxypeptidase